MFKKFLIGNMAVTQELVDGIKKQLEGLSPEEQQAKLDEILSQLPPEDREQLMGGGGKCPFCLMAEGKMPVKKVYEDDVVMAILDINPANKGHTLLFPKKHSQLLVQVDDKEVAHMFQVANKLSEAIFHALGAKGTNIVVSNGSAAGQTAPHVLINIIPRFEKDGVAIGWSPKKLDEAEMEDAANKISEKAKGIRLKKDEPIVIKPKIEERKSNFLDDSRIP